MAEVKPLRLKSQKSKSKTVETDFSDLSARVVVDTGVAHLDGFYDYLVPLSLDQKVQPGSRILVPYASRSLEAIVYQRIEQDNSIKLKPIDSIISPFPLLSAEVLELIFDCAKRWAGNPYDIIKAALPPRVLSVEKNSQNTTKFVKVQKNKVRRVFYQFSPREDEFHSLAAMAVKSLANGGALVLVPDERELNSLAQALAKYFPDCDFAQLDSSLPRSDRYSNFLKVASGEVSLVIGTRSAIFAPVFQLQTIIVHRDTSESYYDVRSPGWNARDVAMMRSLSESASLIFSGHSPSSEIARLIDTKWLSVNSKRTKIETLAFQQTMGELLPNRIFAEIRHALRSGPILFLAPRKGYAAAMTCSKCRNEARCTCGGKLIKKSSRSSPECSHCSHTFSPWRCSWCGNDKPHLLGRGSERFAEEIGRAFPGFPVISSEGDHILERVQFQPSLVIATPGSIPQVENGYAAVVVLEGNRFFSQADMRSHERARAQIFQAASRVMANGKVLLVIDSAHPITASLARWNPSLLSVRELAEREEAHLPPYFRSAQIVCDPKEATLLISGFKKSLLESRLPKSTKILGPALQSDGSAKVIILANIGEAPLMIDFIHEFIRRRSAAKKKPLKFRIDPYTLT